MSQNNVGPKFGGLALGVALAVGLVLVRHYRTQRNAPPIPPILAPTPGGVDKLRTAAAELTDQLDAQEARVNCAEDGTLPVEDRLQAVLEAVEEYTRAGDALQRLAHEATTFVPATGADADRFNELRPRLKELVEWWGRLDERLQAVQKELHEEVEKLRKDKP